MAVFLLPALLGGHLSPSLQLNPISLPLTEGRVPLILDGQVLGFDVDSGSARSVAFYGPSYEKKYGEDNPCDDILSRKKRLVIYGDGDFYKYVDHTVTLRIDNRTIRDFKFGLVVKYRFESRLRGIPAPILGISIGRASIPETLLEQLKRREAITTPSYSIHVKEQGPGVCGTLVLDDSDTTLDHSIAFSERMLVEGSLAASLWPLRLFDSLGNQLEDRRTSGKAKPALVDTGATSLYIPRKDFQKILDVTWETMRKQETSFGIEKSKQLLCDDRWVRMVRKEALPYLPTLAYRIGELPYTIDIRIEPKHYVHSCEALCCQNGYRP
ncbi:hypothetical protein FOZ60_012665 [Perkinsus olseni]|uniref:Peptidase A1 domain-containing protein n=1 Tax=Perkinsus olseni TaxID=32597 RepID=A0A7J6P9N1_PEROL|nr:hypothetical protein FOZ60_012665 [Perkinsus olseni]